MMRGDRVPHSAPPMLGQLCWWGTEAAEVAASPGVLCWSPHPLQTTLRSALSHLGWQRTSGSGRSVASPLPMHGQGEQLLQHCTRAAKGLERCLGTILCSWDVAPKSSAALWLLAGKRRWLRSDSSGWGAAEQCPGIQGQLLQRMY